VELNLYAPVLGSAFGSFVAADRLAVTEAVTQDNAYTKVFLEFMILPQIHTST
jgi:hypothetical protein